METAIFIISVHIEASECWVVVPATMPDVMVATAGLPLEVTLVKGWKSKPSLAMANRTLGIGNIAPKRLERPTESTANSNGQTFEF